MPSPEPAPFPSLTDTSGIDWSIRVVETRSGETLWEHQPERVLKTASVGKLFLLVEVARQIEAGALDPAELLERSAEDWVEDSGLWYRLRESSLSIDDACLLIGSVSDNLATNVLIRRIGIDRVGETTCSLGFDQSALLDRVRDDRGPEHPPTLSRGSAAELCRLMRDLERGAIVSPEVSATVLGWLAAGTDLSMVASAFALDPLAHVEADDGIVLRNKTGTISTARIDTGVVRGESRSVAYAVLANWSEDTGMAARRDALETMAAIGDAIRGFITQR
jgi:beta-lactamase class A